MVLSVGAQNKMQISCQKSITIATIFFIYIITIGQISTTFAAKQNITYVEDFLNEVVMLDMNKYSSTVVSDIIDYPSELKGLERNGIVLTLESSESKLHVYAYLIDGSFSSCSITAETGEPEYVEPLLTDFVELARNFLQRYEQFTEDSIISSMKEMLDSNSGLTVGDTTSGNIKMSISDLFNPTFSWTTTHNGVDYTKLQFSYQSYQKFFSFTDDRYYHEIGQTDVNISKDEAISIAQNQIDDFSWIIIEEGGTQQKVNSFNVATIDATLSAQPKGDTLVLYPMWNVNFILDKEYPGEVQTLIVTIWADNGVVNSTYPLTTSNWIVNGGSTIPESNASSIPLETIVLSAILVPLAIVLVLIVKRKR